ncbi:MAG: hypothetical protein E6K13_02290 [Methanobacteriota archaeon]|nr:MAG: hypothetical protein E6K13_02290 [Euryarchaeota archaeon]
MPPGVADELRRVLTELSRMSGCRSVAVARRDGLAIVHRLAPGKDPVAMAELAAATVEAATRIASALEQGEFEQVVVKCAEGTIFAAEAGAEAVLVALFDRDADLSLTRFRLRAATRTIEETLGRA